MFVTETKIQQLLAFCWQSTGQNREMSQYRAPSLHRVSDCISTFSVAMFVFSRIRSFTMFDLMSCGMRHQWFVPHNCTIIFSAFVVPLASLILFQDEGKCDIHLFQRALPEGRIEPLIHWLLCNFHETLEVVATKAASTPRTSQEHRFWAGFINEVDREAAGLSSNHDSLSQIVDFPSFLTASWPWTDGSVDEEVSVWWNLTERQQSFSWFFANSFFSEGED